MAERCSLRDHAYNGNVTIGLFNIYNLRNSDVIVIKLTGFSPTQE